MSVDESTTIVSSDNAIELLSDCERLLGHRCFEALLLCIRKMKDVGSHDYDEHDLKRRHVVLFMLLDTLPHYGPGDINTAVAVVRNWLYSDYPQHQKPVKGNSEEIQEIHDKIEALLGDLLYLST